MYIPLAERLRPHHFSEICGQPHLVGEDGYLSRLIASGKPLSLLLFGPPGSGKTTIARLYAKAFQLPFLSLSAVFNSSVELKKLLKEGQDSPLFSRQQIVFVDELHRFNRSQQDLFLPFLEEGSLILIGATTENPSFAINNALLSRLRVLSLQALQPESLDQIIDRYEKRVAPLNLLPQARSFLISLAQGDGRHLLNLIENIEACQLPGPLDVPALAQILQKRAPLYDRAQEGHYNLISALHKAVRGSDPDAALYWLCRMLDGGEEPLFLARRLIRMAVEDIGLADPQALTLALNGQRTYEILGSPEGELALAEVVLYLALSPKSNAVYTAYKEAKQAATDTGHLNPPQQILNGVTPLMKELGYGQGYLYDPDTPLGFSGQHYFPESMERRSFYHPVERGFEREMRKRLAYFTELRKKLGASASCHQ